MSAAPRNATSLVVRPLAPARRRDVGSIFEARGCSVARGCWCMFYRRSGKRQPLHAGVSRADANRAELEALAAGDPPPGLIGYIGKVPVGWVSLGPREDFARLRRSPVMKPVDAQPVWSVICFVVPAEYRGRGVAKALLEGAIEFARKRGAKLLEAYPVDKAGRLADDSLWFGVKSMYDAAGFKEVARRKPSRPVVRLKLVRS